MIVLNVGMKFESYDVFIKHLSAYQDETKQCFSRQRSTSSTCKTMAHRNIDAAKFPFYYLEYCCYFGEKMHDSKSTGHRKSMTSKLGCPAVIKLRLDKRNEYLVIKMCNLQHMYHDHSEVFYDTLPPVRRLSDESQSKIAEFMQLNCNKKMLQIKVQETKNKIPTLKDLNNIKSNFQSQENNLLEVQQILKDNGADHFIYTENKVFKAVFFQTKEMAHAMSLWPQMIFIDGTYKLTNINLTLMLIAVEDSDGGTRLTAAGLLESEDATVLKWFFEIFKKQNKEACSQILNIMTDKDHTQRSVLKDVFPDSNLLLCLFHSLQTFGRQITTANMKISVNVRDSCLKLLQALAYSKTIEEYDSNYKEFCSVAPIQVIEYFNLNWHDIKNQWVIGFMQNMNFQNFTNNRLESLNSKIKQVVAKNSTLVNFTTSFFVFFKSHAIQRNSHLAKNFTKTSSDSSSSTNTIKMYSELLTQKGLSYVLPQLQSSDYITFREQNSLNLECKIMQYGLIITSSVTGCDCSHYQSLRLPCKHIFATRKLYGQPLFCRTLCHERWTKEFALKSVVDINKNNGVKNPTQLVQEICQLQRSSQERIENEIKVRISHLIYIGSLSTGCNFEDKIKTLTTLLKFWNQDVQVFVTEEKLAVLRNIEEFWRKNKNVDIRQKFSATTLRECEEISSKETSIDNIIIPKKIIVQGKPSRAAETYVGKRKATNNDTPNAKRKKL